MSNGTVVRTADGGVVTLTLARPEKRNAVNAAMLECLESEIKELTSAEEARVLVLRGEGRAFSAGIDLEALGTLMSGGGRAQGVRLRELIAWIQGVFQRISALELPVIAALHGTCLGLGLEMALAADFRIAEAGTLLGLPEILMGIIPDCGGTTRLTRLVGPSRAKRIILTGETITAEEALAIGLVDEVAPTGELDARVAALTAPLLRRSPLALGLGKRLVDLGEGTDLPRQLEMEGYIQSLLVGAPDFGQHLQRGMAELMMRKAQAKAAREEGDPS